MKNGEILKKGTIIRWNANYKEEFSYVVGDKACARVTKDYIYDSNDNSWNYVCIDWLYVCFTFFLGQMTVFKIIIIFNHLILIFSFFWWY